MVTLKFTTRTPLKSRPIPMQELNNNYLYWIDINTELKVTLHKEIHNHYCISLLKDNLILTDKEKLNRVDKWYVYKGHVDLLDKKVNVMTLNNDIIHLKVPYHSQLNNRNNPNGSCNVTSVAMVLNYFNRNINKGSYEQLEDYLYDWMLNNNLSRHSPIDLKYCLEYFGCKDYYLTNANVNNIIEHLKQGFPCIIHTYATSSGHIFVINGYDFKTEEFICNDPYGRYPYNDYSSGESVRYKKTFINSISAIESDNDIWCHFVSI